eukprot:GSA120T00025857001.1
MTLYMFLCDKRHKKRRHFVIMTTFLFCDKRYQATFFSYFFINWIPTSDW